MSCFALKAINENVKTTDPSISAFCDGVVKSFWPASDMSFETEYHVPRQSMQANAVGLYTTKSWRTAK